MFNRDQAHQIRQLASDLPRLPSNAVLEILAQNIDCLSKEIKTRVCRGAIGERTAEDIEKLMEFFQGEAQTIQRTMALRYVRKLRSQGGKKEALWEPPHPLPHILTEAAGFTEAEANAIRRVAAHLSERLPSDALFERLVQTATTGTIHDLLLEIDACAGEKKLAGSGQHRENAQRADQLKALMLRFYTTVDDEFGATSTETQPNRVKRGLALRYVHKLRRNREWKIPPQQRESSLYRHAFTSDEIAAIKGLAAQLSRHPSDALFERFISAAGNYTIHDLFLEIDSCVNSGKLAGQGRMAQNRQRADQLKGLMLRFYSSVEAQTTDEAAKTLRRNQVKRARVLRYLHKLRGVVRVS